MRFIPHTSADAAAMLEAIGAASIDELVRHIPAALRDRARINLEPGRGEAEVVAELRALADRNEGAREYVTFLGAGYYRHYIPAAVRAIASRAEFATSYTPYQAEASQGTTQAIFEFQTLITQLTAMDVANASMYDGASAAAEAVLMARRLLPKRRVIAVARSLWPDYRATIRTYLRVAGDDLLAVVIGYPNAFGIVEPLESAAEIARRAGALVISSTAEALALGLL